MATKRLKAGDKVMIIGPTILGRALREGTIGFLEEYDSKDETWSVVKKLNRPELSGLAWFKRKNIQPVDEVAPAPKKTSSTKELTVDEAFIKEAHKAACPEWKKKLETKFPTILKKQDEYLKIPTKITLDANKDIWIGDGAAPTGKENKCIMSSTHQPIVSNVNGRWMVEFKKIVK